MKLAINLYLNTMLVGLSQAMHFAASHGLDLDTLSQAIDSGPVACDVTRIQVRKLAVRDFSVQAATSDALTSCEVSVAEAHGAGIASPMLGLGLGLGRVLDAESMALGNGRLGMVSVTQAIEHRTAQRLPVAGR
jgi:3-hydroxyisobutyrate dehydrogenase